MRKIKKRSYRRKVSQQDIPVVVPSAKEIILSESDRVTYLYKKDELGTVIEVTNVSYEIKLGDKWITIVRYDSSHGYLHRHVVISLQNPSDTPTEFGVKQKGGHATWLTWAINDIKKRFLEYRRGFLKRSRVKDDYI